MKNVWDINHVYFNQEILGYDFSAWKMVDSTGLILKE